MASRHAVQKAAGAAVVEVWDLPLRLFHWLLVLAVTLAIVTAKAGGEWMAWHGRTGLFILGLVVFRVVWGLVGSTHARFIHFAPTPGRIKAYLSGHWHGLGHNPLGALSVFALLGVLGYQSSTGLISNDDISFTGPLALTGWHHRVGNALMALVGLHVAAILFYRLIKKENLVKPMVTGVKPVDEVPPGAPALVKARPLALWLTIAVSAVTVWAANGAWIRALATPVPATSSAASQSAPAW